MKGLMSDGWLLFTMYTLGLEYKCRVGSKTVTLIVVQGRYAYVAVKHGPIYVRQRTTVNNFCCWKRTRLISTATSDADPPSRQPTVATSINTSRLTQRNPARYESFIRISIRNTNGHILSSGLNS